MITKLQKIGNGLGVEIPKKIVKKAKLKCDSEIEIKYNAQAIIILQKKKPTNLKKMVSKITKNNLPLEEDNYFPIGREVW